MMRPRNDWIALPGSQQVFLMSPVFETIYEGTRGNGKTETLLMDFAQHCGQGFGIHWRGILFRQTYKQLTDVVAKSKRWFKTFWPTARFIGGGDFCWKFPDGEELLLRQMRVPDDYWNYHGHEYPWIGFEELTNWPTPECYESMMSCSRSAFPGMPRKYRATCNPFGVGHNWVKARVIDPAPLDVEVTDEGGTRYKMRMGSGKVIHTIDAKGRKSPPRVAIHGHVLENKPLLAADPEYISKLRAITSRPKKRAWLHGDWNIVAGGMFDDVWDEDTNVIEPFIVPPTWRIIRAFDWGSSKPFSVGWWAIADGTPAYYKDGSTFSCAKGSLVRIGEWYGWNGEPNVGITMLAAKIGAGIAEREVGMKIRGRVQPGPADSMIFDVREGKTIAGEMEIGDPEIGGAEFVPANKGPGSRINGWELMRGLVANAQDREDPALFVFRANAQFLRTVPYAPRDDENMDDVDTDYEDHILDESRYVVLHEHKEATQRDM